ncbi:MAG: PAS domain-containing protein [Planctomycetes bacterium]|nr:PAS domain-containing protein [Planctomycetota bacterium]
MLDDLIAAVTFEQTHDVVLAIDGQGLVVRANAATERVLGLAPGRALGDGFWNLCGPGRARRDVCARAARGEAPLDDLPREDALLAADGRPRQVAWRWARAGDDLLVAIARDETAERRAVEARRKSEERFDLAARAARDLIYDYDIVTERITWGANAEEVFGLPRDALGASVAAWEGRIHPDDLPRVSAKLSAAIAQGATYEDEYRFRRGDGGWATVRDRGLVITGPDGRAVRMIGSMEDVTAERRAHAELAASEARYRFIAETTSDLVYDYDIARDLFLFVGPRVEAWLGVSAERLCAEPGLWWERVDERDRERIRRQMAADLAGRPPAVRYEYRLRVADGSWRTVHDAFAVGYDASGRAVRAQGIMADISELRALQAELAQAQKLESVGRLAGGIAHDFNNLLTGMLANLSLARLDGQPAHLDEVERAIERAAQLVRGLLAYSRRSALSLDAIDLRECVAAVVRLLRPTLGPDVAVEVAAPDDLPRAWADAARVEQVLVNLALNARDAMPDGGTLRFALGVVDEPDGPRLRVAVEDTGVGMTPDVRARAFEPFFTTKAEQGTGLGLAVVLGIVTQHAGRVECESEAGRGSRFAIHLPLAGAARPRAGASPGEELPPRGQEAVLLADDEPAIRRAVRRLLEGFGFEVLVARDGEEALAVFERARAQVRAVVLDLTMPRLSGREVLQRLRALDPDVPVVITTGYGTEGLAEEPGVAAVLSKPYQPADLARTLRRVIDARAGAEAPAGA